MYCPNCHCQEIVKNGFNATKKQMYRCKQCGRQFVLNPAKFPISDERKNIIDNLLLERISLAGIARVVKVSECWLQNYVNKKYDHMSNALQIKKKVKDGSL